MEAPHHSDGLKDNSCKMYYTPVIVGKTHFFVSLLLREQLHILLNICGLPVTENNEMGMSNMDISICIYIYMYIYVYIFIYMYIYMYIYM